MFFNKIICLVFVILCFTCVAVNLQETNRNIIACRSTDFKCFQRQYKSLRDHVLLGNVDLGISVFKPYTFNDNSNSCVRLSGLEENRLVSIQMDPVKKMFTLVLELPFEIQEVDNDFNCYSYGEGPLKKFSGNATILAVYPYKIRRRNGKYYMDLRDENLDVIVDIPEYQDISEEDFIGIDAEEKYEMAEWAYKVVQRLDVALLFALPYTSRLRVVANVFPMHKFFLLYPDENYSKLKFKFPEFDCNKNTIPVEFQNRIKRKLKSN